MRPCCCANVRVQYSSWVIHVQGQVVQFKPPLKASSSSILSLKRFRLSSIITAISLLAGCLASAPITPSISQPSELQNIDSAPQQQSDWEQLAPGLERRYYHPGNNYGLTSFLALRVDPNYFYFRIHYSPANSLTLNQWRTQLPDSAGFINANFFDTQGYALGLLVSDNNAYGASFSGFGGMFQVAPDGFTRVRSLIYEPYQGEALQQAAQAFPMLIVNGEPSYERADGDRASRRTIIGQDSAGRIILMVTNGLFGMRLADLSAYLYSTDLDLRAALNLDGGGSTLLSLQTGASIMVPSFDAVPAVIAFYPRQ